MQWPLARNQQEDGGIDSGVEGPGGGIVNHEGLYAESQEGAIYISLDKAMVLQAQEGFDFRFVKLVSLVACRLQMIEMV